MRRGSPSFWAKGLPVTLCAAGRRLPLCASSWNSLNLLGEARKKVFPFRSYGRLQTTLRPKHRRYITRRLCFGVLCESLRSVIQRPLLLALTLAHPDRVSVQIPQCDGLPSGGVLHGSRFELSVLIETSHLDLIADGQRISIYDKVDTVVRRCLATLKGHFSYQPIREGDWGSCAR